jgi:TonB family protein
MDMSYRTISLASCLFLAGCGSAPPPSAEAPAPPSDTGAPTTPGKEVDKKEQPLVGAAAASAAPEVPHATTQGAQGEGARDATKAPGQAVVASPEPLSGKLTQADIARILEKNGDVFGDCYTLGAGGKTKDFKGVVTVKATIGPSGTVNNVDVTKSTANNTKVDACVREAFKKIKFPHPRDGATSVITFPISFNGIEQIN